MRKFTIFTILLTIIVVVVFGEIIVNEYLPNLMSDEGSDGNGENLKLTLPTSLDVKKSIATNVLGNYLGADVENPPATPQAGTAAGLAVDGLTFKNPEADGDFLPVDNTADVTDLIEVISDEPIAKPEITTPGIKDFEDETFASTSVVSGNVYLRDEQIKSAGFVGGYLEKETFDGLLFKTVPIDNLLDVTIEKTVIRSETALLAKVYIFKVGLNANANEVYELLKLRASQGLGIVINETNEYGVASFYMNDPARPNTAFLTVRISGLIYSFSYPKPYHSQIKNLIKLIEWEME